MKVLSLLAQKGGTGKSTLAAHLAVEACRTGPKPVVILDLDPQASLHRWYMKRAAEQPIMIHLGASSRFVAHFGVRRAIRSSARRP